jgi:hypothetical protein
MSCIHPGNCKCLHLLLLRPPPLLPLLLPLRPFRLHRLLLSPHLRCLPRMCCCLLLVLCLLPSPLLHLTQGGFSGYNGLMRRRRQNERRHRHGGDNKRNRNKKLDSAIRWRHW